MLVQCGLVFKLGMHACPSRSSCVCTESLHHSRRSTLALLIAMPPLLMAGTATAADTIAGRNERMVVPILGDLMGLAGPGGIQLNRAQAQLGKLAESLGQLEQLASDLELPAYTGSGEDSMTVLRLSSSDSTAKVTSLTAARAAALELHPLAQGSMLCAQEERPRGIGCRRGAALWRVLSGARPSVADPTAIESSGPSTRPLLLTTYHLPLTTYHLPLTTLLLAPLVHPGSTSRRLRP